VIGDISGDANGSRAVRLGSDLPAEDPTDGGGAHGDDPQSGCGDDGTGGGAQKSVTPDPLTTCRRKEEEPLNGSMSSWSDQCSP
jgi:hypothetical protein